MFDGSAQDQTTAASTLSVYVVPGVAINDIVLIGLLATQVQVYGGVTGATLLRTVAVPAPTSPAASVTLEITGLGIAAGQRIGLVITRSGTVGVSAACYGTFSDLGGTLAGAQVSLVDYSRVSTDAYGVTSITRRGYSRRLQGGPVWPPPRWMQSLQRLSACGSRWSTGVWWTDSSVLWPGIPARVLGGCARPNQ